MIMPSIKYDTLEIREFCASVLVDEGLECISPEQFALRTRYQLEHLARLISLSLKLPAKVLQENREIASWPDGLWQYIRKALRLKYRRKAVLLDECLLFPGIALPPYADKAGMRVHYATRMVTFDPWAKEEF